MRVRSEEARDEPRVHAVDVAAFGRSEEATLVRALRAQVRDAISLVAEEEEVVGHILFTPVTLSGNPRRWRCCRRTSGRASGQRWSARALAGASGTIRYHAAFAQ